MIGNVNVLDDIRKPLSCILEKTDYHLKLIGRYNTKNLSARIDTFLSEVLVGAIHYSLVKIYRSWRANT